MPNTDRMSTNSTVPQGTTTSDQKSYISLTSSKSSMHAAKDLYKSNNHVSTIPMQPKFFPFSTEVRQRVISARILHKKTFQNQLSEAKQIINNLKQENRMLLTIHQRQDAALSKYESNSADLPNLLNSQVEELNGWEMKYKKLQANSKELEEKLKQKENQISILNEEIRHYAQLNKNKNLDTREVLLEKIQNTEQLLTDTEQSNQQMLVILEHEIEHIREQLFRETKKVKEFNNKLELSRKEVDTCEKLKNLNVESKKTAMSKRKVTFRSLTETSTNEDTDASISRQNNNKKKQTPNNTDKLKKSNKTNVTTKRVERGDGDAGILNNLNSQTAIKKRVTITQKPQKQRLKNVKQVVGGKEEEKCVPDKVVKQNYYSAKSSELEDDDFEDSESINMSASIDSHTANSFEIEKEVGDTTIETNIDPDDM